MELLIKLSYTISEHPTLLVEVNKNDHENVNKYPYLFEMSRETQFKAESMEHNA